MGKVCCSAVSNSSEVNVSMTNTYVPKKLAHSRRIAKNVNDVKIMKVHRSTISYRTKPKTPHLNSTALIEVTTEKPKSLQSIENSMEDLSISLHVPTNFKIEALHFREEKSKESLHDKYVVEDIVGQGSFGQVRKIRDRTTGEHRAIKIIRKSDCKMTDNYVDEIEIFKKMVVRHVNP